MAMEFVNEKTGATATLIGQAENKVVGITTHTAEQLVRRGISKRTLISNYTRLIAEVSYECGGIEIKQEETRASGCCAVSILRTVLLQGCRGQWCT